MWDVLRRGAWIAEKELNAEMGFDYKEKILLRWPGCRVVRKVKPNAVLVSVKNLPSEKVPHVSFHQRGLCECGRSHYIIERDGKKVCNVCGKDRTEGMFEPPKKYSPKRYSWAERMRREREGDTQQ